MPPAVRTNSSPALVPPAAADHVGSSRTLRPADPDGPPASTALPPSEAQSSLGLRLVHCWCLPLDFGKGGHQEWAALRALGTLISAPLDPGMREGQPSSLPLGRGAGRHPGA